MYQKRGGIRLFKSWTLVRLYQKRGGGRGGGLEPKNLCTNNSPNQPFVNFIFSHYEIWLRGAGGNPPPPMVVRRSNASLGKGGCSRRRLPAACRVCAPAAPPLPALQLHALKAPALLIGALGHANTEPAGPTP